MAQVHRVLPPTCHTSARQCPLMARRFAETSPSEGEPRNRQFAFSGGRHDLARGLSTGLAGRVEARPRSRDRATCGAVIVLVVIVVLFLFVHVVFLLFVILSS